MMKPKYYPERVELLRLLKGETLDVGCNYTDFHKSLLQIDGEVVGLDVEVTNYREKMVRGDSHLLPFKEESFDSVFAGEVIEHLTNPALFVKEVERVLKRGGVSVFTIPNMYSLTVLYIMLYIKKREINYEPSEGLGHVYCWDISLFRSVIKRAVNLDVVEFGYTEKEGEVRFGRFGKIVHKMFPDFFAGLIYIALKKT